MIKTTNATSPTTSDENSMIQLDARYAKESGYGSFGWFKQAAKGGMRTHGRSRRKEFWMFVFGCLLLECIAVSVGYGLSKIFYIGFYIPLLIVSSLIAYPFFTVSVRRLHDIGRSGWWFLLWIAPSLIAVLALTAANYFYVDSGSEAKSVPVTMVAWLWVLMISGWVAIFTMMTIKTSDKMNKYGFPAKRVGRKVAIKNTKGNTKPA